MGKLGKIAPKALIAEAKAAEKRGKRALASARYAQAAMRYRRSGRLDEARSLFDRARRLSPESPRLYVQLALLAMDERNEKAAKEAMEAFSRHALHKRPRLPEYRAYLEAELKAFPALRQVFYDATLKRDRSESSPFLARARLRLEQGDTEGALRTLLDGLKTKTPQQDVLDFLRNLLEKHGDPEAPGHLEAYREGRLSRADFIALVRPRRESATGAGAGAVPFEDPEEEKTLSELISDLEDELGVDAEEKPDEMEPLLREFRRQADPILGTDYRSRLDLALAFHGMGLEEAALDELKRVPPESPFFPQALVFTGVVLFEGGSFLAALDAYQRCLRDDRASADMKAEARYQLVRIYLRLGDVRQAASYAKELERERPSYRDLPQLRAQIGESLGSRTKENALRRLTDESEEGTRREPLLPRTRAGGKGS